MPEETGDDGAELTGLHVLVAENVFLIADEIRQALAERGATVLGPVRSAEEALAQIEAATPDAAVLNIGLDEGATASVAAALQARGVAFVIVTGYNEAHGPELRDAPLLRKPFTHDDLVRAVARIARVKG